MSSAALLASSLSYFIQIYSFLLIVRILLTWFPTIEWMNQIAATLSTITDPYLNIFRSFIPPLGMMDISPIVAIISLQILQQIVDIFAGSMMAPMGY